MLKDNLIPIIGKVMAGVVLVGATSAVIVLASGRNLPFLSKEEQDYSSYYTESEHVSDESFAEISEASENVSDTSEVSEESGGNFYDELKGFGKTSPVVPDYTVYNPEVHELRIVDTSSYQEMTNAVVSLKMGYLIIEKDNVTHIYTPSGVDIASAASNFTVTSLRDRDGRPLFISGDGKYYTLSDNNTLIMSDYNDKEENRGFTCEYPRYLGLQNSEIYRFRQNGLFGYRTSAFTVISPMFKEAFAFSDEGVACVLWKHAGGENLIFYNNKAVTISMDYCPPTSRGEGALGYFYFDDGLIRVRRLNDDKTSDELLIDSSAKPVAVPQDYTIVAYTDSRILLKKDNRYGYMTSRLEWITLPEFSYAKPFYEGLAAVCDRDGRYGMIDRNGDTVIPFVFDYISNCSDGLVLAFKKDVGWTLFAKLIK